VQADITDREALAAVPDVDAIVFAASSGVAVPRPPARRTSRIADGNRGVRRARARPRATGLHLVDGVHGDHDGDWVNEETPLEPTTDKTEVLAEAERIALEHPPEYGYEGTVARYAGLYGPDRYRLERYLEGPVTEGYLNMVHRDDAAGAVRYLLEEDLARGEVVQVVDDEPASSGRSPTGWPANAASKPRRSERRPSGSRTTIFPRRAAGES